MVHVGPSNVVNFGLYLVRAPSVTFLFETSHCLLYWSFLMMFHNYHPLLNLLFFPISYNLEIE